MSSKNRYVVYHSNTWLNGDDSNASTRTKVTRTGKPRKVVIDNSSLSYYIAAYSIFNNYYNLNVVDTDFMVVRIEGNEEEDGTFALLVNTFDPSPVPYKHYKLVDTLIIEKVPADIEAMAKPEKVGK